MRTLWHDFKHALRMFRRNLGFTAVIIMTLTIGIGGNVSIFSVANAILFRPLPFQKPNKLISITEFNPAFTSTLASLKVIEGIAVTAPDFLYWRRQAQSFEDIAATSSQTYTLIGVNEPERVQGLNVTVNLFSMLGVKLRLGRFFLPEDEQADAEKTVLISDGLWRRRFGADPNAIGRIISLNNQNHTIIGVLPADFQLWSSQLDIYCPLIFTSEVSKNNANMLSAIGRLKTEIEIKQAQDEITKLMTDLDTERKRTNLRRSGIVTSLQDVGTTSVRQALLMLLGAGSFLLLIACTNVANLFLTNTVKRDKEFGIRVALGAGRLRIAKQLFMEGITLTIFGGIGGVIFAALTTDFLVSLAPRNIPRLETIAIDLRVLLFTISITFAAAILSSFAPILTLIRRNPNEAIKQNGSGVSQRSKRFGFMITVELSLSLVLLVGAVLLMRSYISLIQVNPGFNPENTLTMRLSLPPQLTDAQRSVFLQNLIERVNGLPDVQSAAIVQNLPLSQTSMFYYIQVEGNESRPGEPPLQAEYHAASSAYFRTVGTPLLKGRSFTENDSQNAPGVIIINEATARKYFPNTEPLGKHVTILNGEKPREIVGVVGNVKHRGLDQSFIDEIYVPYRQFVPRSVALITRTTNAPLKLVVPIKEQIYALDKNQPVFSIATLQDLLNNSLASQRFSTSLLSFFAFIAVFLSAIGVYGVVSHLVNQSTREIGIRIALGAKTRDVLSLIAGYGFRPIATGLIIGLLGAIAATRTLESFLFGIRKIDLITFFLATGFLTFIALFACWIPARRAMKVDPMIALRQE